MSNLNRSRPSTSRTRSSTIIGTGSQPWTDSQSGPPKVDPSAGSNRIVSNPSASHTPGQTRVAPPRKGHSRVSSLPSPPMPTLQSFPTAPAVPTLRTPFGSDSLFPPNRVQLLLYTYTPSTISGPAPAQPSPLPSTGLPSTAPPSRVLVSFASLPWDVQAGDYLEIRRVKPLRKNEARDRGMGAAPPQLMQTDEVDLGALEGVQRGKGREGFIFRVGDDAPSIPPGQIQVPNSVAAAFKLQHRADVEIIRLADPHEQEADFIELHFASQYLGRADMWRLGMSLEGSTVHVGEKVVLAGGAVRADVKAIWRGRHKWSSGIVTAKTKTIFRSKSAQVYIFVQLCQEMWEFDEDGERYYEKVVHGFLPDLFRRWAATGASHLVTIILFARVYYDEEEVQYLEKHNLMLGLSTDHCGKWCKDFFRVAVDFEKRSDWTQALAEIKLRMEKSEREILLEFHLGQMAGEEHDGEEKRIAGRWSFAYEGNVLEAINLALNPFDEHYIDRDLSRTGLSMTILTPGTGHFAVDKNLLRLTTERMIDHGIGLDLVCLTKMPLHSVPLFSYVSERPKARIATETNTGVKTKPATPDPLYFDSKITQVEDRELADCYSLAFWVYCSFYSKTHDKPFRKDRFVPRCKMYEIQMLGILDHNLTTVIVPLLDVEEPPVARKIKASEERKAEDRKAARDEFDADLFGTTKTVTIAKSTAASVGTADASLSVPASYQSSRLLQQKMEAEKKEAASSRGSRSSQFVSRRTEAEKVKDASSLLSSSIRAGRAVPLPAASPLVSMDVHPFDNTIYLDTPQMGDVSPTRSVASQRSRALSISRTSTISAEPGSGASTPKMTPAKKLKNQPSKSSFVSRFGPSWLFGSLGARSQPSFPTAAATNVARQDVAFDKSKSRPESPVTSKAPAAIPLPVPGAPFVTPSTPSPSKDQPSNLAVGSRATQPMAIKAQSSRYRHPLEDVSKSPRSVQYSIKMAKSLEDSWRNKANAAFGRTTRHATVNPCNPIANHEMGLDNHNRRWQHVRPRMTSSKQHTVKWRSLCAPACLPLTTDSMPTPLEIQEFYDHNPYTIACDPDQISFLVRQDAAQEDLPLAVMREMASQRLSPENFQFVVLPHDSETTKKVQEDTRKVLLYDDANNFGLRAGGASEVLKDANGPIYLSWSNHIHRLAFDNTKQTVTVQRFVRKIQHSMEPVNYKCLVWPYQMNGYQEASAKFSYPNIDSKHNFNYLDRLIAGEVDTFEPTLRYWRTRFILIPSDRDPLTSKDIVPTGEKFSSSEVLLYGASKVLELIGRNQWKKPGNRATPLRLLGTTFDPSACVLDEGLMTQLERLTSGKEKIDGGKTLEGMTLAKVAEMMDQPNNGLIIIDRWWDGKNHEECFTGDQFCEWLRSTFVDVDSKETAILWGRSLLEKGLIEHVTGAHHFLDGHFFYRLRTQYESSTSKKRKTKGGGWFGAKPLPGPREIIERHAATSVSPANNAPLARLTDGLVKKKKIKMSQSVVIDLDPSKKSDRAEVAVLHADIIHNSRNAFHFELNWLGVTAGLLDEIRAKCTATADKYGLRFVEAPVEQIKDIHTKCAYRAAIPIPLALAPPVIPDLHLRLTDHGTGQAANFFEYAILTQKFGFVLDVEASDRYPDTIEVAYSYRGQAKFEYSQFCHKTGLALVQCIGGEKGFLWADNRLFISALARRMETYPNAPLMPKMTKQEQAIALREEMTRFCADPEELRKFYEEVTPPLPVLGGEEKEHKIGEEKENEEPAAPEK
ncbi:SEA/GATOR complex protein SEA1/DEPDC5, partial [Tremellales sp. Uapishka_1]